VIGPVIRSNGSGLVSLNLKIFGLDKTLSNRSGWLAIKMVRAANDMVVFGPSFPSEESELHPTAGPLAGIGF
jgi:hypothetical protein